MQPFSYERATRLEAAIAAVASNPTASFIAGGTDLIGAIKDGAVAPSHLVDINALPLAQIELDVKGIRIGALARMSDVANDATICDRYPVLAIALQQSASPQVRNAASIGGNLMQRVRCSYFRDPAFPCNRRAPGTGCSAIEGYNRTHAIFGTPYCIAVHPSDLAVALTALDAVVCTSGSQGDRRIPIDDFYLLPDDFSERETALDRGELLVAVEVSAPAISARSHYLKVRDRAASAFALVSAAVVLEIEDGTVRNARVALGGAAPKPWRSHAAEDALHDRPISEATFSAAAEAAVRGAKPQQHNTFKIELIKRVLFRALSIVGGLA